MARTGGRGSLACWGCSLQLCEHPPWNTAGLLFERWFGSLSPHDLCCVPILGCILACFSNVWKSLMLYLQLSRSSLQLYPSTGAVIPLTRGLPAWRMGACLGHSQTWCFSQHALNSSLSCLLKVTLCWFFAWPSAASEETPASHCWQMSTSSFVCMHNPSQLRIAPLVTLFSSGRSLITIHLPSWGCCQCSSHANVCLISLPLSPMPSLPWVDLSFSSDLQIGPSGGWNPRSDYLSAVPSIDYCFLTYIHWIGERLRAHIKCIRRAWMGFLS